MRSVSIFILMSILSLPVSAGEISMDIQNFTGEYLDPAGSGVVKKWITSRSSQDAPIKLENKKVLIKREQETYEITVGEIQYDFDSFPFLNDEYKVSWNNLNLYLVGESLRISSTKVHRLSIPPKDFKESTMTNLRANCVHKYQNLPFRESVLKSCLENASLDLLKFIEVDQDKTFTQLFFYDTELIQSETEVKNIKMRIRNNNFNLKASLKDVITLKFTAKGKINYDEVNNTIVIRLDKAKGGFFDIKGKIFERMERSSNPNIRVDRPHIYYRLNAE
jgi:hypothetical protein